MRRITLVLIGAVGFVIGWATAAHAFALDDACGSLQTYLTYSFHDAAYGGDEDWTSADKDDVNEGADNWEYVPDPYGGYFINVVQQPDNSIADWEIELSDINPEGVGSGLTKCSSGTIELDWLDEYETMTGFEKQGLASHEFGHGADLAHAGKGDSWDTKIPSMATCIPLEDYKEQRYIRQDDYANGEYRYDGKSPAHANTSFENGADSFWGYSGGASGTVINGGASDGSYYLKMHPGSGGSGYVFQTTRVIDPKDMRARVNFKKYYTSSTGSVYWAIYARELTYEVATDPCQSVANNKNDWALNDPGGTGGSFVFRKGKTGYPTTSWQWPDTAEWTTVDNWEGVDARLRIYNYMELSGQPTYVRLDHARIRHT